MVDRSETGKVNEGEFSSDKKHFKIWRAEPDAKACFLVTPRESLMVGSKENFIACTATGTTIMGNSIVLGCMSEQLRNGGMFVNMNDFIQCIPSTITTPGTNMHLPIPPLSLPMAIASELPSFLAALA